MPSTDTRETKKRRDERERTEAKNTLRDLLPPGSTVYTILRHTSASGMTRDIDCYVIEDNQPRWISHLVARATRQTFNEKREAIRIGGAGMDMGFAIVYDLSRQLYPLGFDCIGDAGDRRCPSNDHSNGDRDYTPHRHESGGYALRHEWM